MTTTLKQTYGTGPVPINLAGPKGNVYAIISQARMTARELCWTNEMMKTLMDEMMAKKNYVEVLELFTEKFGYMFTLYRDEEDYDEALQRYDDDDDDESDDE
jgi:hypothetical protein